MIIYSKINNSKHIRKKKCRKKLNILYHSIELAIILSNACFQFLLDQHKISNQQIIINNKLEC